MQRESKRYISFAGSVPKCPQQPGMGQDKTRRLGCSKGLPCGGQGPMYLNLLPPGMCLSRKLD